MSFYANMAAVATRLLTDKGQLLTFTRKTKLVFDSVEGKRVNTTSTFTGYGAAFDYKSSEIDGTKIIKGDIRLLLNATTTEPLENDTTVIDGDTYAVKDVGRLSPAGTVVIYTLQLRK